VNSTNVALDHQKLQNVIIKSIYSTSQDDLMQDFYVPCLSNSSNYDRIAGYFSSAIFSLAPMALSKFISNNGKIRLLCSPNLSQADKSALNTGLNIEKVSTEQIKEELHSIYESGDIGKSLTNLMANLISNAILEIRIAIPENGAGIYHDKMGIFNDGEDSVLFIGSANETAAAWSGAVNHEQITSFTSWQNLDGRRLIEEQKNRFEKSWRGYDRGWRVLSGEKANDFLEKYKTDEKIEISFERLKKMLKNLRQEEILIQKENNRRVLRTHQSEVFAHWIENGYRGLVVFATGGGKTIVGISAIEEMLKNKTHAIVAVPSLLLLNQWHKEIKKDLPNAQVSIFGGDFGLAGRASILRLILDDKTDVVPKVILTTFGTASTETFREIISNRSNIGVIVDEVHGIGSSEYRLILDSLSATKMRMGLSATPERYNDSLGTSVIYNFFGQELEPKFTLEDAIKKEILVPYDYEFEMSTLSIIEQEEYDKISLQISQLVARISGGEVDNSLQGRLDRLRIGRSRILKGASDKVEIAYKVLASKYSAGDRWFIYCQDQSQLNAVRQKIISLKMHVLEYHSNMVGDRATQLDFFEKEGGVMLAIKCLDEGIDIPRVNKALILASSSNPREYVQRRGRVLRRHEEKYSAKIIDTLVNGTNGQILSVNELFRAREFAKTARNESVKYEIEELIRISSSDLDPEIE
jgi:superfamily II DNA or RNA helicase